MPNRIYKLQIYFAFYNKMNFLIYSEHEIVFVLFTKLGHAY